VNFNSPEFVVFYAVVLFLYYCLPLAYRWPFLLGASYWFYAQWNVGCLGLIVYATICAYLSGLWLKRSGPMWSKVILFISIALIVAPLFIFKYSSFFLASINEIFLHAGFYVNLFVSNYLLPAGISFFTFQAISYVVDVYRFPRQMERHAGIFALYIAFFPQLVAGPIERAASILHQFRMDQAFDRAKLSSSFRLIVWGLFKKMVIADRLAVLSSPIFSDPASTDGVDHLFAAVVFSLQIYCDFSAYSDIARGVARSLGVELMRNFENPYLAKSLSDFWRRWHISLSTWFRDYIYVPLGGGRVNTSRWALNILIVFAISGLWHGAAWVFVVWGALHGLLFVSERLVGNTRFGRVMANAPAAVRCLLTFFTVTLLWIPFRVSSLADAWHMMSHLHTGWRWRYIRAVESGDPWMFLGPDTIEVKIVSLAIIVLIAVEWIFPIKKYSISTAPKCVRWACYIAILQSIILFGIHDGAQQFIYFQF
jgi:alginate O-acetyltransferase complex protein AlgI